MSESYRSYLLGLGAFLLGGALVWFWYDFQNKEEGDIPQRTACHEEYPLISSQVDCESTDKMSDQIEVVHGAVMKIVKDEVAAGHVKRASVFYRDLRTRRWFGIDDRENYYPGSLVKLPLAMGYYKLAELQPEILQQKLVIPKTDTVEGNIDQHYPPDDPLQPETPYTVEEMIRHMLVYSDNAPFHTLMDAGKIFMHKAFNDLGISEVYVDDTLVGWQASVRTYATAIRALYNVSYLDSASSNKVLSLLLDSTFTKGLVAGVPEDIKVAHKFGEGTGTTEDGKVVTSTLNDCGIIYKPQQPFILCVMTEGQDFSQMESVIQMVARTVYNEAQ